MSCPECYGSGWIIMGKLKGDTYGKPCDYAGCDVGKKVAQKIYGDGEDNKSEKEDGNTKT